MGSGGGSGGIVGSVPLMGASGPYLLGLGGLVPGCVRGPLVVLADGALRVLLRVFRRVSRCFPFVFLSDGALCCPFCRQIVFPRAVGFRVE